MAKGVVGDTVLLDLGHGDAKDTLDAFHDEGVDGSELLLREGPRLAAPQE